MGTQVDKEAPKAGMTQVGQKIAGLFEHALGLEQTIAVNVGQLTGTLVLENGSTHAFSTAIGQDFTLTLPVGADADGNGVVDVSIQSIKIPSQLSNATSFVPKTQFSIEGAKVEVRVVGTPLSPITVGPYLNYEDSFSATIPLDEQKLQVYLIIG